MNEKDFNDVPEEIKNLLGSKLDDKLKVLENIIFQYSQGKLLHVEELFQKGILKMFFGDNIKISDIHNYKNIRSQYETFVKKISSRHSNLYDRERKFTRNMIFYKMAYPMDIAKYLYPLYNNSTGYELNIQIGKLGLELSQIIPKLNFSEASESDLLKFLTEFYKNFRDYFLSREFEKLVDYVKDFLNKYKTRPQKDLDRMNLLLDKSKILIKKQNKLLEEISKDPTEFGRDFLRAINYIQSHMEYFCKYIRRLIHIGEENHDDYNNSYYNHYSTDFDRTKFKKTCENKLSHHPDLKNYLKELATQLNELRNINAHQIPRYFYLSPLKSELCFPVIGKETDRCVDHEKIADIIITYAIFINSIDLHPENPYEKSENRFLGLF